MTKATNNQPLLVDAEWVRDNKDRDEIVLVDATTFLTFPEGDGYYSVNSGQQAYEAEHIPGAVHADLHLEFADQQSKYGFSVLDSEEFAAKVGELGISNDSHVVIYDHGENMWATRFWWNLRLEGHDRISVLNGGLPAWKSAGYDTASGVESIEPTTFTPNRRDDLLATKEDVKQSLDDDDVVVINVLAEEAFDGSRNTYGRVGHIPKSVNIPVYDMIGENGELNQSRMGPERYAEHDLLNQNTSVITQCGGGIAATLEAFNFALNGRSDVAVYDGSMTEWADDESLPLETGK